MEELMIGRECGRSLGIAGKRTRNLSPMRKRHRMVRRRQALETSRWCSVVIIAVVVIIIKGGQLFESLSLFSPGLAARSDPEQQVVCGAGASRWHQH